MISGRAVAASALTLAASAAFVVAPAIDAREGSTSRVKPRASAPLAGQIGSFTPASGDPKLAALLERSGLSASNFRFTPTDSSADRNRSVTVAVRARTNRVPQGERSASVAPESTIALAPIAYNLGVSVGWKRFAVSGDMAKVDLGGIPGSQERLDVGLSYAGKRAGGAVKATAARPLSTLPAAIADDRSYSIDVGGSYSLTRNLNLTAGVRYKTELERERLPQLQDDRRDSQAVYVGTSFRF